MKKFYSQFRIMLMTFVIGLTIVWLLENNEQNKMFLSLRTSSQNLSISNNSTSSILSNQSLKRFGWRGTVEKRDCFETIKYKCENGFRGIYHQIGADETALKNELEIISGFYNTEPQQFEKEAADSETIEKNEKFESEFTKGMRIILKKRNQNNNKEFYEILYYDSKEAQYYIVAPTLQLALEFEQWKNDFNSRK